MNQSRERFLLDGLLAGLIGYATVALFFVALNLLQGRSAFHTAALLGADLFYGLQSPDDLAVAPGPVLAFNGVHILLFLAAGFFMAWLATLAERIPEGWYLVSVLFLIVMPHTFGLPIWFGDAVVTRIPLWAVVAASSLAALAMGAYLLAARPGLRTSLRPPAGDPDRARAASGERKT